ncbi:HIT domain-containing protein [Candidatus Woesearchaeota archaeon]|nr:HIT domain-containing protein [Candidatus Woesearchaeota archaeon]
MELTPEQKQQLEEQKKQCIFCQIIEGKIPSKKVYDDKLVVGILDINPATNGHVLFMPKEHYPIMPLIPPETFKHMFDKLKAVDKAVKDALLCKETTVFIANGGAAGQQSAHFMMHIIPREGSSDGLDMLDLRGKEAPEGEIQEVAQKAGPPLAAMLRRNLPMLGYIEGGAGSAGAAGGAQGMVPGAGPVGAPGAAVGGPIPKVTKEQLIDILNSNPQVKQMILQNPDQFKQLVPQHPQLSQLFAEFDVDEIIEEIKKGAKPREPGKLNLEGALK